MPGSEETETFRFAVAFSFAGPHRDNVRAIAELVSAQLDPGIPDRSKGRVFFDEWFEHEILGDDMDVLLQRFYHDQSRMVVADVSEEYAERPWCQAEARAIRALRFELDPARDETGRLRLLNIRLGEGEVPGIFKTTAYLDGINKTAEECADLILKRHALLVQRLGAKTRPAGDGGGKTDAPSRGSGTDTPPAEKSRNWVWHSTLATRAAGQVSVLACVETLFAVALYWWIALRYNTHWHLVTSVFIAPLLLLRSPESMELGVQWFSKDWFGFENYREWPVVKKFLWNGAMVLSVSTLLYFYGEWLDRTKLPESERGYLSGRGHAYAMAPIVFAYAFGFAFVGVRPRAGVFARAGLGVVGFGSALVIGYLGVVWGVVVIAGVIAGLIGGMGAGFTFRALFFRGIATLSFLIRGVRRLPDNWRENNFLADSFLPAELIPGIRDFKPEYSLDGFMKEMISEKNVFSWVYYPLLAIFWFIPAFLYRLNIKATAWFWWPLAYLLKPAPVADAEGQQKQALCWPWTNPFQKLWIIVSVLLVVVSVAFHNLNLASWSELKGVPALPLALKVSLAINWTQVAPWHWAQWIIAGTGLGMLVLAGNARSHDVNGNWREYRRRWPQNIRLMTGLQRTRTLATIALLLMALGALLLQDRSWQANLPVPESMIRGLEHFYRIQR